MKKKYFSINYNKSFFFIVFLFIISIKVNAQCSFAGAESSPKETITFCIDNTSTRVTANDLTAGQYVAVNVVKGFNYTFTFPELFGGNENVTIFNASNTTTALAFVTSTTTADAVINWTATISGQIYVLVSRGNCNNDPSGRSSKMTIRLNNVGNTQDSQTVFGTNTWIGHVYNHTDGPPPGGSTSPTSPSTTTSPFLSSNYVGYYAIGSETISEGFGGSANCFPVFTNGVIRTNIYADKFSVRYRMRSTRAAGCYLLNVNGDDGVRVYVDGVLVFNQWKQQSNTSYCNNLIYLNGNSDIVLDYYEHEGGNVVGFSLASFDGSANVITSSSDVQVCSNVSPGSINGASFGTCGGGTNTVYQWQVSSDNVTFTDISGANSEDYTPLTVATTTTTDVKYYRRSLKAFATNASSCVFYSNAVKVTTSTLSKSFTTAPASSSCSNYDITYTTQSGMTNYVWSVPGSLGTDYSITSGGIGSTSNTVTLKWLTSASKTVTVNYTSSCSGTIAASNTTTVGLLPNNVSSGFSATTICTGDTPKITFDADDTGFVGPYTITYKNNSSPTIYTVTIPTAAATSFTPGDNPTTNTTYTLLSIANATCTRTSGFGSAGANLIVRALPTATINGTTTVCQGATSPNITFTNPQTAAITVTYNINGGISATVDLAASSSTIVAAPTTASGTYTYNLKKVVYQSLNTCSSQITGTNAVITVSGSAAPTIGTITNIDCVNSTGSVVLNGLPTTGSWTVNPGAITGSGSSVTITGLTAGSYAYTVSSAAGCVSPATATGGIVITNNAAITWDGTAWSNGTGPTSSSNIIFNGNYASSTDLVGCSCQVNTGKTVVFNSGNTLKVTNQVLVTGTGTLTFENKASLVQVNDAAVNSGNIIYKRITSAVSNFDYTYWSSPVKNQKLIDVSPTTLGDKFLSFDSSSNNWKYEDAYNTTMVAGKGYIIRGPQENYAPAPPSFYEASFKGEPINGVVSVAIGGTRVSNLIGNPYPSAVSADAFLTANNSVLSGTLYFWTHNTSIQLASNITNGTAGSGSYAYTSDDYASYNLTGGTGTRAALSNGLNASVPDGQIAAGQGFFGTSIAPGTATFNNAMRLKGGAIIDNSKFFRLASTSKMADVVEKNRLWLNLMNDQGAFKQTLVGYITGATNEYESAYDGSSFNANAYVNFYSLLSTSAMAIQGRALPFNENDIVPLGYKSNIAGDFKIAIDQVDGLFTSQVVYLEDKLLNVIHNLKETPYTFTTEIGVFNERFAILYANKTLGTADFDTVNNTVFVATKNKEITINASSELIDKVAVYDFSGRQLYSKTAIDSNLLVVNNLTNANVALIVKVVLNNGKLITRKIVY